MTAKLKAPYPYFGGKSSVAKLVWDRLGDCDNFIEPFCGSAAVLLARPHPPRVETANDIDCFVSNFWRSTKFDPEGVAEWADAPVNECDLHATHKWLVLGDNAAAFRKRMREDPDYYDVKVAGRWVWGLCMWIGSGWCDVSQLERHQNQAPRLAVGNGILAKGDSAGVNLPDQRPHLNADRPLLPDESGSRALTEKLPNCDRRGILAAPVLSEQIPLIGDPPRGRHAGPKEGETETELSNQVPRLSASGQGIHSSVTGDESGEPPLSQQIPAGQRTLTGVHKKRQALGNSRGVLGTLLDENESVPEKRQRLTGSNGMDAVAGNTDLRDGNRPQLADAYARGRGVHGNDAMGTCEQRRQWLLNWFNRLRDRLRTVRVCCGHWLRVCDSESVTTRLGVTGIFLDPPYALNLDRLHAWVKHLRGEGPEPKRTKNGAATNRSDNLYGTDGTDVDKLVAEVQRYCVERGGNPMMRLALAGYAGEHDSLEAIGWERVEWKAQGGYGNRSERGKANAKRECLWFSPHCLKAELPLFAGLGREESEDE